MINEDYIFEILCGSNVGFLKTQVNDPRYAYSSEQLSNKAESSIWFLVAGRAENIRIETAFGMPDDVSMYLP